MRSKWQNFKILQEINYTADRQEWSFKIRTSLSRGTLAKNKIMRNLLIKLGLKKINQSEYFAILKQMHEDIAELILQKEEVEPEIIEESKCEIKIFFWVYVGPILQNLLPHYLFDKTMKFYSSEIVFSTINQSDYSFEFLENLLKSRHDLHNDGISNLSNQQLSNKYMDKLSTLWFKTPFTSIEELNESNEFNFNLENKFLVQSKMKLLITYMIPGYKDSLKKLIKKTKK
jgi:hypothetical protein